MKDVISVDTTGEVYSLQEQVLHIILSLNLGYEYQMSDYAGSREEEEKYEAEGLKEVNDTVDELLQLFHSLLISKLPEKRPTIEQFRGTDLKYDAGAFDGYNKCLDDMHQVIDELFEEKK